MRNIKNIIKSAAVILAASFMLSACGSADPSDIPMSSQYVYNSLSDKEKPVFNRIYSGVTDYKYKVRVGNLRENEFEDIIMKFYSCGSEFFYMSDEIQYSINSDGYVAECYFTYDYYENATESMREQLDEKIDEILSGITDDMTDADKLKYIHDYIVNNTTYDANAMDCDNVYGALIKHKTHCQGYSKSVCCLCDRLGIESTLVTGTAGGGHMWNMVKVDGKWYNLDVTWDDPDYGLKSRSNYFLISDSTISQTHKKDTYMSYPSAPSDYSYISN